MAQMESEPVGKCRMEEKAVDERDYAMDEQDEYDKGAVLPAQMAAREIPLEESFDEGLRPTEDDIELLTPIGPLSPREQVEEPMAEEPSEVETSRTIDTPTQAVADYSKVEEPLGTQPPAKPSGNTETVPSTDESLPPVESVSNPSNEQQETRLDTPLSEASSCSNAFSETGFSTIEGVNYDLDQSSSGVIRLRPTSAQWDDFPAILDVARKLGAENDGCFKVVLPDGLLGPLPKKPAQKVPANAYRTHHIDRTRIWQVGTIPTEGKFPASTDDDSISYSEEPNKAFARLRTLFTKNKNRQMRDVRYRVDVPAWNAEQRREAGVPEKSPLHPLKGDKLDRTKAVIPGIHTPYVYESGPAFGATFQIHAEDYRLSSLNHLYKGRKIWIVIPSSAVDHTEAKLERRGKCSQFMRHRAEFVFPTKLDRLEIPYRVIDQQPGETIVILPDAYHEGFSTGYTLAEAKNYAEENWTTATYQPCDQSCNLLTKIPAEYMELIGEGEQRIDLCAYHDAEVDFERKRKLEEADLDLTEDERPAQKMRATEVATVG